MMIADIVDDRLRARSLVLVTAALLVLAGCATIRRYEATSTEQLLAAAGFQMQPADSPERLAALATRPPLKLVAGHEDGNIVYTFSDPQNCRCLYVGGPKEFSAYQRLRADRETTDHGEPMTDWAPWGRWTW